MIARPKLEERLIFPPLKREMRRRISGNDSNYNVIYHCNLTSAVSDCHQIHCFLQIEKGKKSALLIADSIVNIEHTQNMAPQQFQIFCKLLDTKKITRKFREQNSHWLEIGLSKLAVIFHVCFLNYLSLCKLPKALRIG